MSSPLQPVANDLFDQPPLALAAALVGTVLRRRVGDLWLGAQIVETEAYALHDRASHSSLGRTPSREPMFAPPGTLYLYRSRGGPSLNLSAAGPGNAVLIKAAVPVVDALSTPEALEQMHALNPKRDGSPPASPPTLLRTGAAVRLVGPAGVRMDRTTVRSA